MRQRLLSGNNISEAMRPGTSGMSSPSPSPSPSPTAPSSAPAYGGPGSSTETGGTPTPTSAPSFSFGGFISGAGDMIGNAASGIANVFSNGISSVFDTVGDAASNGAEAVGNLVTSAADVVNNIVSGAGNAVGGLLNSTGNAFGGVIGNFLSSAGNGISGFADSVGNVISGTVSWVNENVFQAVINTGIELVQDVVPIVTGIASFPLHVFGNAVEGLGDTFGALFQGDFSGAIGSLLNTIKDFGLAPFELLLTTGALTLNAGVNVINNLLGLTEERGLNQQEIDYLESIFGNSIDYSSIQIQSGGIKQWLGIFPQTTGNDIFLQQKRDDYLAAAILTVDLL